MTALQDYLRLLATNLEALDRCHADLFSNWFYGLNRDIRPHVDVILAAMSILPTLSSEIDAYGLQLTDGLQDFPSLASVNEMSSFISSHPQGFIWLVCRDFEQTASLVERVLCQHCVLGLVVVD